MNLHDVPQRQPRQPWQPYQRGWVEQIRLYSGTIGRDVLILNDIHDFYAVDPAIEVPRDKTITVRWDANGVFEIR